MKGWMDGIAVVQRGEEQMDGPFARFAASLHVQPPAQTTNGGWVGQGEGGVWCQQSSS